MALSPGTDPSAGVAAEMRDTCTYIADLSRELRTLAARVGAADLAAEIDVVVRIAQRTARRRPRAGDRPKPADRPTTRPGRTTLRQATPP